MKGKKQIMVYYINNSNELYHYGVKGMQWGVRHDPERSGNGRSRSRMSTAKKVAIGVGVAAAVAGVTYAGIKTGKARQIAKGAARLARRGKSQSLSGYQLRKIGISTFEPSRVEINRGTSASAARQAYYQRHGKSFTSSNITKARKIQGYSNKNYTDLGRAYYKNDLAQRSYEKKLKTYKNMSDISKKFNNKSWSQGNEILGLRSGKEILTDDIIKARTRANRTTGAVQKAVNKAYSTRNYKRTRSINYRNLTRRH